MPRRRVTCRWSAMRRFEAARLHRWLCRRVTPPACLSLFPPLQPAAFIASLKRPRAIIILVQAGKPVDDTINLLSTYLEPGDLLIDGGNEWFPNTTRRGTELASKGILYMGEGCSCGRGE